MKLGSAPKQYDSGDQARMRGELERSDAQSHKKTGHIEVGSGKSVIFTDTATGKRYPLLVTNGTLTLGPNL